MEASHLFLVALHSAFFPMIPPLDSDERGLFVPHTATTVSAGAATLVKKTRNATHQQKVTTFVSGKERLSRHKVLFFRVGCAHGRKVASHNHRHQPQMACFAGHTLRSSHCHLGHNMKEMSPPPSEHNSFRGSSFPRHIFIHSAQPSHAARQCFTSSLHGAPFWHS